jgi:hypothetical protein
MMSSFDFNQIPLPQVIEPANFFYGSSIPAYVSYLAYGAIAPAE